MKIDWQVIGRDSAGAPSHYQCELGVLGVVDLVRVNDGDMWQMSANCVHIAWLRRRALLSVAEGKIMQAMLRELQEREAL